MFTLSKLKSTKYRINNNEIKLEEEQNTKNKDRRMQWSHLKRSRRMQWSYLKRSIAAVTLDSSLVTIPIFSVFFSVYRKYSTCIISFTPLLRLYRNASWRNKLFSNSEFFIPYLIFYFRCDTSYS